MHMRTHGKALFWPAVGLIFSGALLGAGAALIPHDYRPVGQFAVAIVVGVLVLGALVVAPQSRVLGVLPSTDAGVLASRADGTLLVVRLERSLKKQTREAVRTVQDMGGNVLGCFVTELRGHDPESDRRLSYEPLREGDVP